VNDTDTKKSASLAVHPELRRSLLTNPTDESLNTIIEYQLFDQPCEPLANDILCLLPSWEQQACAGNGIIATLIQYMSVHFPDFMKNEKIIQAYLLRIRILASTPGTFSFSPFEIQEHLIQLLQTSDVLADLPELDVVAFSADEIAPLASDLKRFHLTPHSRRYVQNLFHPARREAILSVLAYIAKSYPITFSCRQAYALMLSLDNPDIWAKHPFCLRLIAKRCWEFKIRGECQ